MIISADNKSDVVKFHNQHIAHVGEKPKRKIVKSTAVNLGEFLHRLSGASAAERAMEM